ncbi:MAG: shikimate kinase [Flavobacteriia bacterium]|nr:shikimate kinase [Flavobacteriia bacterium]OIP46563.1 MAG: shikimate kinase [Flavobacteriaceae bacterium CG2_30_31_66]PIV95434.1 MAG: shikimate kinase [Flavobacteriaceae bacterium CG17_big_fil_post_rev_8_21_14_2_50_31_13]PIX11182.1 MAG: shikimate kinase [Flavobacteriaceae bacterium CG_4_8_14_3_um_filter_31_8]PIY14087.1 MAG: shikimate kinase [Flavobacteriaceae bacterium CG_4_10_14_3_um_filter_31_253]PIZ09401.1 MAG: shikimate kinase [Flavobacteriaceae bacterium CG_4_10_14_0_8_um_filter_31_99]
MKIVLLGYMASGKSTIGKKLSEKLKMPFIDLDNYISKKENKSVSEIFSQDGEIYFRKKEHEYLKEVLVNQQYCILSLGGGTPCYATNMELIHEKNALSIYLKASIQTLSERLLKNKSSRPLIALLEDEQVPEFIAKHLFERRFFYEQAKKLLVVDKKSTLEIVNEIENLLL